MDNDEDLDLDEGTETAEGATEQVVDAPKTPAEKPAEAPVEPPTDDGGADDKSEDKKDEVSAEASDESVEEGGETTEKQPEEAKPLTAEDVANLIAQRDAQTRADTKEIDTMEEEVLKAYYPQGLSNVLVDEQSGREIRTPQDVVDLSGDTMTIEEATKWLMNEQYKLDKQISDIKSSARELAETNANFRQGATRVIAKYQQIFDKYPQLQERIYKNYMKTVKMDGEKDLILSAPDIEEYYADVMEPYVMAFNYKAPEAAPPAPTETPAEAPKIPESKQTAKDRMDVSGDSGASGANDEADPNDPEASLNKLFEE